MVKMSNNNLDELISVAVPRRYYPLVLKTLAQAMAAETPEQPAPAGQGSSSSTGDRDWTDDEIIELESMLTRPTIREMLNLTSEHLGKRITFGQVASAARREPRKARGDLAALTKLVRKRFRRNNWPVRVTQAPDGLGYEAIPEVAAAWKRAVSAKSGRKKS
jgi:hypothetical protein